MPVKSNSLICSDSSGNRDDPITFGKPGGRLAAFIEGGYWTNSDSDWRTRRRLK